MAQMTWGEYSKEVEKTGGFTLLPVGPHNVRVDTATVKAGKSGSNQILARLVVTDGPSMGGSILNNMAPFKNNGDPNGFFLQGLAALGLGRGDNPEFWAQLDAMDVDQSIQVIADNMVGREATITVSHDMYNGTMRDNVKKMVPKGALMPGAGVPGAIPPGGTMVVNVAAPAPQAVPATPQAVPAAPVPPAIAAPPVAATQQPVPSTTAAAVAPAVAPATTGAPMAAQVAPMVPQNPVVVPAPQAPPVVPAAAQQLVRPDEAPF